MSIAKKSMFSLAAALVTAALLSLSPVPSFAGAAGASPAEDLGMNPDGKICLCAGDHCVCLEW